jgi:hypothetical protein
VYLHGGRLCGMPNRSLTILLDDQTNHQMLKQSFVVFLPHEICDVSIE